REDGPVGVDERLQASEVRTRVLLVVDLDADAQTVGEICGLQSKLRRVLRQRGVPVVDVSDAADREHHADVVAGEVLHDRRSHTVGYSVRIARVGGLVEQLEWVHKTENDEIDGGLPVAAIDDPMVL